MPYQVHNMCVHEWTCELQNTNPQYQVHIQHAHFRMCTCVLLQTTEAECTKPTHTLKFDVKSLSICFSQFMNSYTDVTLNPNVHNWWEKALFHFFFNETPSNAICHQGTGIFFQHFQKHHYNKNHSKFRFFFFLNSTSLLWTIFEKPS